MKSRIHSRHPARRPFALGLLTCLLAAWVPLACSQAEKSDVATGRPESHEIMVPPDGYAIGGYDPVSYFLDGEPRKGLLEYAYRWRGATWLFATSEHRDLFEQNPASYAPIYGGWCAYGLAEGYAAETDPVNAWTIHHGKLYLNWDAEVANDWRLEVDGLIPRADENWPTVKEALGDGTAEIYWHD